MRHTPKPWTKLGYQIYSNWDKECPELREKIAETFGPDYDANGQLISAAPEMYELLQEFSYSLAQNTSRHMDKCPCSLCKKLIEVKQTLAKVEGKEEGK